MSDRVAFSIIGLILAAILADYLFNGLAASLFLARKFADLSEYLAFWR